LRDIIGDDDKDGVFGWYTEVAKFVGTGGASGLAGEHASLAHFRDHLDAGTDPHGSTLTQTNLVVSTSANFDGADTNFNSGFFMPNAGGSFLASTPGDLPKFASATSDPQAYSVRRTVLGTEFVDCTPHVASLAGLPSVVESVTERDPRGAVFFYKNTLGNGDYAYDLNKLTAAAALPSDGPELTGIVISFLPPRDLNSVSTDPYPHVATIPPTTQIAQISLWRTENPLVAANGTGARHATPLLIQYASVATLTVPWGTGATADDPAAYSVDLSGVSTSDLQMDTYHNLTLRITLENNRPVDSAANQSTYSFGLNAVAAIFRTRLIHP
jgi:hypothetical protein